MSSKSGSSSKEGLCCCVVVFKKVQVECSSSSKLRTFRPVLTIFFSFYHVFALKYYTMFFTVVSGSCLLEFQQYIQKVKPKLFAEKRVR